MIFDFPLVLWNDDDGGIGFYNESGSRQNCRGGDERMEDWINFFAWGGSSMCHPPVPLIEDDCAA